MLPPVLEIYVVWHPNDDAARAIADEIIGHYRGTAFTGLIGGAVEVFVRSLGWRYEGDSPRPIPTPYQPLVEGVGQAKYSAIVPILGNEMATAVQEGSSWRTYIETLVAAQVAHPDRVGVYPYRLHAGATDGTILGNLIGTYQGIAANRAQEPDETLVELLCRDLSQSIAQSIDGQSGDQITVFLSHTKRSAGGELGSVSDLIELVRNVLASTRLGEFFDASDLQPGTDWAATLIKEATRSAFLALRTDLYPSREWCQKEILTAKRCGMPIVILDAVGFAEERGSFLMDHVPRAPIRYEAAQWKRRDVFKALNLLVDECLKRSLWTIQRDLAFNRDDLKISWWAPHAPEPVTLVHWLESAISEGNLPEPGGKLWVLHPDPPLGPDEREVLEQMLSVGGIKNALEVMTPRQLAARGG